MHGPPHESAGVRRNPPPEARTATLNDVDIQSELDARPRRSPNREHEHSVFALLAVELTGNPREFLQMLARVALDLCSAHTAGVSLLEGDDIRSQAVAGVLASARGTAVPREHSPSGLCIDGDQTQLMYQPDRCFPAMYADPRIVEILLVPFHDRQRAIGTVWIASHSQERQFDREDERILNVLARYASAGRCLWTMHDAAAELNRRNDRLLAFLGHELRNPLAAIEAAAGALEQQMKDTPGLQLLHLGFLSTRIRDRRRRTRARQIAASPGHEPCSDDTAMDLEPLVVRIKNEFLEMPGLCLTVPQAMRLWGLDFEDCQRVIEALIDVSFLQRTSHGKVVRAGG